MKQLLIKDLKNGKIALLTYLFIVGVFLITNKDPMFIISMATAIVAGQLFYVDAQSKAHIFWSALPLSKKDLIKSRYVSVSILFVVTMLFVCSFSMKEEIIWQMLNAVIILFGTSIIVFPIYYLFVERPFQVQISIAHVGLTVALSYLLGYSRIPFSFTVTLASLSLLGFLFSYPLSIKMLKVRL